MRNLWPVAAVACLIGAATAHAQQVSPWGVLDEIAERDLLMAGYSVAARWVEPDQVMEVHYLAPGVHYIQEITRRTDGKLALTNRSGPNKARSYAEDLVVGDDGELTSVSGVWMGRDPDGRVFQMGPKGRKDYLEPLKGGTMKWFLGQVAKGKVRAANPSQVYQGLAASKSKNSAPSAHVSLAAEQVVDAPKASAPPVIAATDRKRVALVIGNGAYAANLGGLANPASDARLLAASLRSVGFDVEVLLDADQKAMKRAISNLGQRMANAGKGATGLFYYAGHGMQSRGTNYLIPIGAAIEREADIDLEAVAADTVLSQMEEASVSTNIIILDACRNTPVLRSFRSAARGLARMEAPNGSFISYSTAPGSVAYDGDGSNSPFAAALASEVRNSNQPIEITFRNVRRAVLDTTGGAQTPWDSSSLIDTFVFNPS